MKIINISKYTRIIQKLRIVPINRTYDPLKNAEDILYALRERLPKSQNIFVT
tara:strand:- start:211 stop:366 length:156 start_codon:yes stop_codon:yes gene_type:complete